MVFLNLVFVVQMASFHPYIGVWLRIYHKIMFVENHFGSILVVRAEGFSGNDKRELK